MAFLLGGWGEVKTQFSVVISNFIGDCLYKIGGLQSGKDLVPSLHWLYLANGTKISTIPMAVEFAKEALHFPAF